MTDNTIPYSVIDKAVRAALDEDLGVHGDVTTQLTVDRNRSLTATITVREEALLAGLDVASAAFSCQDSGLVVRKIHEDGAGLLAGDAVLTVSGSAHSILAAERSALNFLCHIAGVATQTKRFSDMIAHTDAKICCTRKTTPGLRAFEKYAVKVGGGQNHRYGLSDAILIKDNHIAANEGDIRKTVERALSEKSHMMKIEVEVDTLLQLQTLLDLPIDAVLLDNMGPDILRQAVALVDGRFITEASGGVNIDSVKDIAETGVDLISVGRLTNSSLNIDFGLDYKE